MFKQRTAYEMRIRDWSSDVCSSDDDRVALRRARHGERAAGLEEAALVVEAVHLVGMGEQAAFLVLNDGAVLPGVPVPEHDLHELVGHVVAQVVLRSEEHTSELQSLMRISYAVFCLKKKKK